ncbi:MAG: hypothetical protein K0V04_04515 [Deltaproteobacteria bacterium]|nr:hypothetical protein [Deltaproteobacteria bacterium]
MVGLLGCQPHLPELEANGERVAVGVHGEVELCAGTLRAFDEQVSMVETELGITRDPDEPLRVYVVDDTAPWCKDVMACYIGGWVDATFVPSYAPRSVWHELVHQVVSGSDLGMTDRFLSEGLAGTLGDDWCPPAGTQWPQPPLSQLLAQDDVAYEHYPRAAQLVDYLRQEHGTPALVRLIDCIERGDPIEAVDQCMETVLGIDLTTLDEQFSEAAPPLHGNPALCGGDPVPWQSDTWVHEAMLACGDDEVINTFRSPHGRETAALVDFAEAGSYEVTLESDGDATLEIEPCFCLEQGGELLHRPLSNIIGVGQPGRYRIVFRTDDPATTRVRVSVRPGPGPS